MLGSLLRATVKTALTPLSVVNDIVRSAEGKDIKTPELISSICDDLDNVL